MVMVPAVRFTFSRFVSSAVGDAGSANSSNSQRLVETAKAQLDADVRRARDELRREVADLATAVAEKLVRRSLRDEDHRRIVADTIAKVGN